jgi:cell division protein FtsL
MLSVFMGVLLLSLLTKALVFLFLAGIVGSAIVVVVTFIEDGKLLLESDETPVAKPIDEHHFPPSAARVGE